MENMVIGQILGIMATIVTFISYQVNTKKQVLFIQTFATLCTATSYLFLGAFSGLWLNVVCLIRNVTFYFQKEQTKSAYISATTFAVAMLILGALSWQGWISLLITLALAANTIFLSLGIPQLLRKSILLTSTLVLIYNCFVFSVGGIANELISIISSIIGIIRFHKKEQKGD